MRKLLSLFVLIFCIPVLVNTAPINNEKWAQKRELDVSAEICLPQSISVLKRIGADSIEISSLITTANYQANKLYVFCAPNGEKSRFIVSVEGPSKDLNAYLGNLILNDPVIGSANSNIKLNESDNAQIEKSKFDEALSKNKVKLFVTYNKYLKLHPNIHGRISVRFIVLPNGSVDEVSLLKSNFSLPDLEQALIESVKTYKFPVSNSKTVLTPSYDFLPR